MMSKFEPSNEFNGFIMAQVELNLGLSVSMPVYTEVLGLDFSSCVE